MKKSQVYANWLNAEWLEDNTSEPHEITLTIASVRTETESFDKPQRVLKFNEKVPEFGVNSTNWDSISEITGKDDDDLWVGATITLYRTTTQFGNKIVPCVRIKAAGDQTVPATTAAPELFGEVWASKFIELGEQNTNGIADIRSAMIGAGYDTATLEKPMAQWPRIWKDAVKAACENKQVEAPQLTEDDIPF